MVRLREDQSATASGSSRPSHICSGDTAPLFRATRTSSTCRSPDLTGRGGASARLEIADLDTEPFSIQRRLHRTGLNRTRLIAALLALVVGGAGVSGAMMLWNPTFSAGEELAGLPGSISATPSPDPFVTQQPENGAPVSIVERSATPTSALPTNSPEMSRSSENPVSPTPVPNAESESPLSDAPDWNATPVPSPVVSRVELMVNGGFEDGNQAWTMDDGARSAAVNAHNGHYALVFSATGGAAVQTLSVIPGATYRLSVWYFVGAAGDRGEVEIRYIDVDGRRSAAGEPDALSFTSSHYARKSSIFTVPDNVTMIQITILKPAGDGILAVDDVSLRRMTMDGESKTV